MEELERTTSAREMRDWSMYYALEPWGSARDNMHAGIVSSTVFNMLRSKDQEPRQFVDFMLKESDPAAESRAKTQKFVAALRAMAKPKRK